MGSRALGIRFLLGERLRRQPVKDPAGLSGDRQAAGPVPGFPQGTQTQVLGVGTFNCIHRH